MDVAVCVKHVPDTEAAIRIRADGHGIDESGLPFVMNYYDEHGVEEALRIKERLGGTVTLLTAGPVRAALALRSGLAMGADAAVHVAEEGATEVVRVALQAVITLVRSNNETRYTSLPGNVKARRTPATTKTLRDLGQKRGELGMPTDRVEILDLNRRPQRWA